MYTYVHEKHTRHEICEHKLLNTLQKVQISFKELSISIINRLYMDYAMHDLKILDVINKTWSFNLMTLISIHADQVKYIH